MKVAVIADDFSGAAELAGIAHGCGLTAEVHTRFDPSTVADVVAVDTDSRMLPPAQAAERAGDACRAIREAHPDWIFKKTDSVLRGNVATEIRAICRAGGYEKALLVPANPSKGRIIRDGFYFVAGIPLSESAFAADPTHPATTSRAGELLEKATGNDGLPIRLPDAAYDTDMSALAAGVEAGTLAAGAADFFTAMLKQNGNLTQQGMVGGLTLLGQRPGTRIFVCGSQAAWGARRDLFREKGWPVFELPPTDTALAGWEKLIDRELEAVPERVLLAIGDESCGRQPEVLCERFAHSVSKVLDGLTSASALFLEGGATAIAVMRALMATRFEVAGELGPGAPVLKIPFEPGPYICPKPGSYPWPDGVLE